MDKKNKIVIGSIVIIFVLAIIGFVIAGDLIAPEPEYTISDVFEQQIGNQKVMCFKIEGYKDMPCFNSTEFVDSKDTQSLINFHNKMAEIKSVNALNIACDADATKCPNYDAEDTWAEQLATIKGDTI